MKYVSCNLCKSDRYRVLYKSNIADEEMCTAAEFRCTSDRYTRHGRIVKCLNCGFIYANPRDDDETINSCYTQVVDEAHIQEKRSRILTFTDQIRKIHKYIHPPGLLLDVGSYTGYFLQVALMKGWEVEGIEPSNWANQIAEKEIYQTRFNLDKVKFIHGTVETVNLESAKYNLITMWDVIEHLGDAMTTLIKLNRALLPGGLLCLTTHDMHSFIAKTMGSKYPFLLRMHNFHFTRDTLRYALEKTGFTVIKIEPHYRTVRVGYFLNHITGYATTIIRLIYPLINQIGWLDQYFIFPFSGLVTVYARKK